MKPRAVRNDRGYKEHEQYLNKTIRDWAKGAGVQVADKGAIPKTVRTTWIDAHQSLNNLVIWRSILQDGATGRWSRSVEGSLLPLRKHSPARRQRRDAFGA